MLNFFKAEKAWVVSHLIWIVSLAVALGLGRISLADHDERVAAEAEIRVSQATVANLEQQIKNTDAAAATKVQTIVKIVHDTPPTPAGVVAAVPQLTDAPLNARVIQNDPTNISVAAIPFLQFLQQSAIDKVNLSA